MIQAKTKLGKWSVGLIIAMPVLFFLGSLLVNTLYQGIPAGGTILGDMAARPFLAFTMLLGVVSGVASFVTGLISIVKYKERSMLVSISTLIGVFLIIMLIGELLFPD